MTQQIDYQDDRIAGAFEVYAFQTKPGSMAAFFLDITDAAEGRAGEGQAWRRGCASSRSWSRSARSPRASPTRSTTP